MTTPKILITGATGKTGSRILTRLWDMSIPARAASRGSDIPFDWETPETWPAALDGIETVYVSYFPDLAVPGAVDTIAAFCDAAKAAGVRHLILLSGRGETHAKECEDLVRESGLIYTLLRCSWFSQNFSEGYLRDPMMAGVIALPAGDTCEALVDVEDIVDVAIAALTEKGHENQLYEITGPRLLHFSQVAAELSRAANRTVTYTPLTLEQFRAGMTQAAGPFIADVITHVCSEALDGRNEWLGDGVQRALGRAPRDFADFCDHAARLGVWRDAA